MIWLLTVLISCLTASAETCDVTLQVGKVIQPKPSVLNGATFRSHLHTETKELCQQGELWNIILYLPAVVVLISCGNVLNRQYVSQCSRVQFYCLMIFKTPRFSGCCDDERCDTVLYTASRVGPKGNNCFYFDCQDHCVFRDSAPEESNYSVAIISQSPAPQELPGRIFSLFYCLTFFCFNVHKVCNILNLICLDISTYLLEMTIHFDYHFPRFF